MKYTGIFMLVLASTFYISFGGMLSNGDFEEGPTPPTKPHGSAKTEPQDTVPKWVTKGLVEIVRDGTQQGGMVLVVPEGNQAVRLGQDASIRQKVKASKGRFYALTFSFARTCAQDESLNVTVSPNDGYDDSSVLPLQTIYNSLGYDTYGVGFKALANVIEITLHNVPQRGEDASCGPIIDTVDITILDAIKATGGNLVKNGDFGQGPYVFHGSPTGVLIPPNIEDDQSPLPAWMVESTKAIKYIDSLHFFIPKGQRAVELVGGQESSIAQIIRTDIGKTYVLTFLVGDAGNKCVGPLGIEALAGKAKTKINYMSKGKGGFTKGQLVFRAEKTRTRIVFRSLFYTMTTEGTMCGPVLDDVKVLTSRYGSKVQGN